MSIGIIFAVLALAMVIGPIMLMKPSGRQRQLATLRQQALELGLQSRIISLPEALKHFTVAPTIAVYQQRWQDCRLGSEQTLLLARKPYAHDIHFYQHWDWVDAPESALQPGEELIKLLSDLPDSILAIEISRLGIGVLWLEKGIEPAALQPVYPVIFRWLEAQGMIER